MHFEFDAKIDQAIHKSIKSALRLFKGEQQQAQEAGSALAPPSYEAFISTVDQFMEASKNADLNKLRTPGLRELFERAWSQKLRNYATHEELRGAYNTLLRRYRATDLPASRSNSIASS